MQPSSLVPGPLRRDGVLPVAPLSLWLPLRRRLLPAGQRGQPVGAGRSPAACVRSCICAHVRTSVPRLSLIFRARASRALLLALGWLLRTTELLSGPVAAAAWQEDLAHLTQHLAAPHVGNSGLALARCAQSVSFRLRVLPELNSLPAHGTAPSLPPLQRRMHALLLPPTGCVRVLRRRGCPCAAADSPLPGGTSSARVMCDPSQQLHRGLALLFTARCGPDGMGSRLCPSAIAPLMGVACLRRAIFQSVLPCKGSMLSLCRRHVQSWARTSKPVPVSKHRACQRRHALLATAP
jgi:hypothetical protein